MLWQQLLLISGFDIASSDGEASWRHNVCSPPPPQAGSSRREQGALWLHWVKNYIWVQSCCWETTPPTVRTRVTTEVIVLYSYVQMVVGDIIKDRSNQDFTPETGFKNQLLDSIRLSSISEKLWTSDKEFEALHRWLRLRPHRCFQQTNIKTGFSFF